MQKMMFSTNDLTKRFGNRFALKEINMNVPKGSIYGFVGENGAGKTTLFRIIAGLCEKTSGKFSLFSDDTESEIHNARKKIGCTIEAPAIYESMSVFNNMKTQCIAHGITDKNRINEVLSLVNLTEQKSKRASNLSYGMKQRLALGFALLHEPTFLVLDEPTNGLDPMGIIEFRKLFLRLNKECDITILIASHILSELEHLATHYGIIHKGKILEEITSYELFQRCNKYIKVVVDNTPKSVLVLQEKLKANSYQIKDSAILLYDNFYSPADVSTALSHAGIGVSELSVAADTLETYFTNVISGGSSNEEFI